MRARRLGRGGLARGSCAGRVVKNVAGVAESLARVKIWARVCVFAGFVDCELWIIFFWHALRIE